MGQLPYLSATQRWVISVFDEYQSSRDPLMLEEQRQARGPDLSAPLRVNLPRSRRREVVQGEQTPELRRQLAPGSICSSPLTSCIMAIAHPLLGNVEDAILDLGRQVEPPPIPMRVSGHDKSSFRIREDIMPHN